jgi:hypothetical protein
LEKNLLQPSPCLHLVPARAKRPLTILVSSLMQP